MTTVAKSARPTHWDREPAPDQRPTSSRKTKVRFEAGPTPLAPTLAGLLAALRAASPGFIDLITVRAALGAVKACSLSDGQRQEVALCVASWTGNASAERLGRVLQASPERVRFAIHRGRDRLARLGFRPDGRPLPLEDEG